MSDNDINKEEDPVSIFDGGYEEPEPDAITSEGSANDSHSSKEVTKDGHLKMSVESGGIDPYDHSSEVDAKLEKAREDGTAPPPMPDVEPEGVRNPAMLTDPMDELHDVMEQRFRQSFADMKVEVSKVERDAFVRAALHDEELVFDIELEGVGVVVQVAMPSDEFTNSAFSAVNRWGEEDHIDKQSDLQWLLAFQQMHAWYQIRSVNGEPTSWSDYWEDGKRKRSEIRRYMENPDNFDDITSMNAARWRMLVMAMRIAEFKYKICMQNWRDRSFFTGADTD